ncbi:hypothetical protein KKB43_03185 [Patescibacteria group bacterium]|nr:hypothetical protein [Patescibacteria group bacterium]MBU4579998.1 hypothetical protein [Patescibacteria group bacterium]
MSLIEININNCFNKKENHETEKSKIPDNFLFQNQNFNKMNAETNSLNATSVTNNAFKGSVLSWLKDKKSSILRDVLVGATGTIIGAIVTYLFFGIK